MYLFSPPVSVLFTVRATRAPMGTKATPTASHSVCLSMVVHDVDAQPKKLRAASSLSPCLIIMGLWIERAATEMPAVRS